ncbi:MFS transporter [Streptomyces hokutonensis]|uniref:MFS transporter n=1 Tax=Streptomyces hokutonensis TaxID=1306990 RepID=UPI003F54012B
MPVARHRDLHLAGVGRRTFRSVPVTVTPRTRRCWLPRAGLAVLITAVFLPQVDFFIVNVALPTIQSSLGASAGALELVVAGSGTAYAATLVLGGRLGDMIGRRRMLLTGMTGFVLTSLVCGTAPGIGVLLAARSLRGAARRWPLPRSSACSAAGECLDDQAGRVRVRLSRRRRSAGSAARRYRGPRGAAPAAGSSSRARPRCWRR